MPTNADDKNSSARVQPRYLDIRTDAEGREHCYRTTDRTIHIIEPGGGRTSIPKPAGQAITPHYIEYVRDKVGWRDCRYGYLAYEPVSREVLLGR